MLEPDDFALGPDEPDPPPADLIKAEAWHGIMDLPDDVAIRTSNDHGADLAMLHELWAAMIPAPREVHKPIFSTMMDANDELAAATVSLLHGFYRQAIGTLRNMLDILVVGAEWQLSNNRAGFEKWTKGEGRITFGQACDRLVNRPTVKKLAEHTIRHCQDDFFRQKNPTRDAGWIRRIYDELSEYTHSRPQFSHSDLWRSTGPIYVPRAFELAMSLFVETVSAAWLLIRLAGGHRVKIPKSIVQSINEDAPCPPCAQAALAYLIAAGPRRR